MIDLLNVFVAAEEVQSFCKKHGWRFCFIGGLAVQRWGEPRMTQDADLTLLTGFGNEEGFVDTLLGSFTAQRRARICARTACPASVDDRGHQRGSCVERVPL